MAFDTFLKIDGLVDDTTVAGHQGEIEVFSFSWGASNPRPAPTGTVGAGGGVAPAGKVSFSSFNLMKRADKVSPALLLACASGAQYKTATVSLYKAAGGQKAPGPFIEYDFSGVVVESIQWSGSTGGDDTPTESVSLAFTKVVYRSASQNPDGSMAQNPPAGWDLSVNQKF